ncbi:MAG: hypothetical protein HFJ28_03900 [Clostridia bacterium]|jgi:hypothetical protein|nr:hypothetical protein [Clostridia bacterium]
MPGFHIHLSIGNRYIEKHKVENEKQFLAGVIAPDFEEKEKSHYTKACTSDRLIEHLKCKVSIEEFLKEHKLENDYEKGWLLHLITDKLFFTEFFSKEYLENVEYQKFTNDLYASYGKTNSYLEKKYHIEFSQELRERIEQNIQESRKQKKMGEPKSGQDILPIEKLDKFIEEVSNIDLEQYKKAI